MKLFPIIIVGLVASASSFAAQTQPAAENTDNQDQRIEQLFQSLDTDHNGVLDANEAQAERGLRNAFPRLAPERKLSQQRFTQWYKAYDAAPAQE